MTENGVPCFSGACAEVYRETVFKSSDFSPANRLPNAVKFYDYAFCFLVHHTITHDQMQQMTNKIRSVLNVISHKVVGK
jgi:dTDP-4-amino-4,6-dideoxygalactose transaminase